MVGYYSHQCYRSPVPVWRRHDGWLGILSLRMDWHDFYVADSGWFHRSGCAGRHLARAECRQLNAAIFPQLRERRTNQLTELSLL